jgi:hypothetical protein
MASEALGNERTSLSSACFSFVAMLGLAEPSACLVSHHHELCRRTTAV